MQVTKTVEETRKQIKAWKKEGKTIGCLLYTSYKNCRIPVDRPISPMKFVKFIMEHFYYVPSSQLEFNFEIEGIVAFEEHIAEKDINKSRIIV